MNIKLTLLSLALSVSSACIAQTLEFNHCTLRDMKFVTSSGSLVNIRKGPSTESPKLYHGCLPESDDCAYMWSDNLDNDYELSPCVLSSDDVMVVMGEDKGFWKSTHGNTDDHFPVYVAKSVTKTVMPNALTNDIFDNSITVCHRFSGVLKDIVLTVDANEVDGWSNILVGMIEGNALVFSHSTPGRLEYDSNVDGIRFDSDSEGMVIRFGDKYKGKVSNAWAEYETLDLGKLIYPMQVQLLEKLGCKNTPNIVAIYAACGNVGLQSTFVTEPDQSGVFNYSVRRLQPAQAEGEIFGDPETAPRFPGGNQALAAYLSTHIKYPNDAKKAGVQGRVIVKFVVDKEGKITEAEVERSVHKSLDKEALRVVKAMPKWEPGTLNGKPVRVRYRLPIKFNLNF